MGLADLIRSGVALANSLTSSLQVAITHEAWIGQDAYGTPTYAAASTVQAIVEQKLQLRQTGTGRLVPTMAKVIILQTITANGAAGRIEPIDNRDRITLPDGTTGPIVDTAGIVDPATDQPYFAELWLGSGAL